MYLIEQFAEGAGKKGGEFYTPRQIVHLMVEIVEPRPGMSIYDPTCGSGGMLLEAVQYVKDRGEDARVHMDGTCQAIPRVNLLCGGAFEPVRARRWFRDHNTRVGA